MSLCLNDCMLPGGTLSNVTLRYGRIFHIGKKRASMATIQCKGRLLLPGLVDIHVHLRDFRQKYKEDWLSGTYAASAGGITTLLEMPNTCPPTIDNFSVNAKIARANCGIVNFGIHLGAVNRTPDILKREPHLNRMGSIPATPGQKRRGKNLPVASLKIYMGSTTGELLIDDDETLDSLFNLWNGVFTVHCEDERVIRKNRNYYGNLDGQERHEQERGRDAAFEAVKKIVELSGKYRRRVHICHISTREEIELIRDAKKRGISITCEVTPHHLFLNRYNALGKGNLLKVNPPLREPEDCEALWKALVEGIIDCIASDHAPHLKEEKFFSYERAPAGMPGLETLLPLVATQSLKKNIPLSKVCSFLSDNPIRIFNLGKRGIIEEGYIADLVLVDIERKRRVVGKRLKTRCRWSPFEGLKLLGWPVLTILSGKIIYKKEEFS